MTTSDGQKAGTDAPGSRQACAPAVNRRPSDGRGSKRSRLEDQALAALLSEPTIAAAATKAGVSESSLLRWLADPAFQARYRAARREVVEQAVSQLQQAASDAVEALTRNLTCGTPAAEISAAKAIIEQAIKGVELVDLAERVEQLEQSAEVAAQQQGRT